MCGIVGVAGNLTQKQEKVFEQLLIVDTLRGLDSTGVLAVGIKESYGIAKQVGSPFELFNDRKYESVMRGYNKVLLGHNRWATTGRVTKNNAHPFDFDTIAGVHNGTLDNKYSLANHTRYDVDSEALYDNIEMFGVRETIAKVRGAWALVWWDKNDNRINFLRNKERPLWLRHDKKGNLYWSSERWMIDNILARNDVECDEDAWELKEDTHLSIHVADNGALTDYLVEKEVHGAPPFVSKPTHTATKSDNSVTTIVTGTSTATSTGSEEKQECSTDPAAEQMERGVMPDGVIDLKFTQSKQVRMEYICKARDEDGNDFCILFPEEHPQHCVRLYCHSSHRLDTMPEGTIVYADISKACSTRAGVYYKANPWSLKISSLFNPDIDVDEKDLVDWDVVNDDLEYETFTDHNGNYRAREQFLKQYPRCNGCESDIIPEQANKFTTHGDIMCPSCQQEFAGYVSFKN